jgi:hypothetical protein
MYSLMEQYQRVVILNLLSETKTQEIMLSNKFFEMFELCRTKKEDFRNSVRYKQYDFHYETQGDVSAID